jgi:Effector Associated Constant Component 1
MSTDPTQVVVRLEAEPDADDAEQAELALRLRAELDELDVASIELAPGGDTPAGAKSGGAVEWGTLLVSMVSTGALTALIRTINGWVGRQRRGTVRIKIGDDELELTGASSEDEQRVIDAWLARHAAG